MQGLRRIAVSACTRLAAGLGGPGRLVWLIAAYVAHVGLSLVGRTTGARRDGPLGRLVDGVGSLAWRPLGLFLPDSKLARRLFGSVAASWVAFLVALVAAVDGRFLVALAVYLAGALLAGAGRRYLQASSAAVAVWRELARDPDGFAADPDALVVVVHSPDGPVRDEELEHLAGFLPRDRRIALMPSGFPGLDPAARRVASEACDLVFVAPRPGGEHADDLGAVAAAAHRTFLGEGRPLSRVVVVGAVAQAGAMTRGTAWIEGWQNEGSTLEQRAAWDEALGRQRRLKPLRLGAGGSGLCALGRAEAGGLLTALRFGSEVEGVHAALDAWAATLEGLPDSLLGEPLGDHEPAVVEALGRLGVDRPPSIETRGAWAHAVRQVRNAVRHGALSYEAAPSLLRALVVDWVRFVEEVPEPEAIDVPTGEATEPARTEPAVQPSQPTGASPVLPDPYPGVAPDRPELLSPPEGRSRAAVLSCLGVLAAAMVLFVVFVPGPRLLVGGLCAGPFLLVLAMGAVALLAGRTARAERAECLEVLEHARADASGIGMVGVVTASLPPMLRDAAVDLARQSLFGVAEAVCGLPALFLTEGELFDLPPEDREWVLGRLDMVVAVVQPEQSDDPAWAERVDRLLAAARHAAPTPTLRVLVLTTSPRGTIRRDRRFEVLAEQVGLPGFDRELAPTEEGLDGLAGGPWDAPTHRGDAERTDLAALLLPVYRQHQAARQRFRRCDPTLLPPSGHLGSTLPEPVRTLWLRLVSAPSPTVSVLISLNVIEALVRLHLAVLAEDRWAVLEAIPEVSFGAATARMRTCPGQAGSEVLGDAWRSRAPRAVVNRLRQAASSCGFGVPLPRKRATPLHLVDAAAALRNRAGHGELGEQEAETLEIPLLDATLAVLLLTSANCLLLDGDAGWALYSADGALTLGSLEPLVIDLGSGPLLYDRAQPDRLEFLDYASGSATRPSRVPVDLVPDAP